MATIRCKKKSEAVKLEVWLVPQPGKIGVEGEERWSVVPNQSIRQGRGLAMEIFRRMRVGFGRGQRDPGADPALFLSWP